MTHRIPNVIRVNNIITVLSHMDARISVLEDYTKGYYVHYYTVDVVPI